MKTTTSARRAWNPLRALYGFFSSISMGIVWVAALIVYAALGSAVPGFRQTFELTEFQYFNHWVFLTLVLLFCTTLVVTTLRRIHFNLRNLGVLTVHAGLLMLCAGSVIYFGQKIEGDVWLDAPQVRVISLDRLRKNPANALLDQFVAVKGKVWEQFIPMLGGKYRLEVLRTTNRGMKTPAEVELKVDVPDKPEKTVKLQLDTPDRPHGQIVGLTDRLAVMLTPANKTDVFYDATVPALTVQIGPSVEDAERIELPELPYYNEHFLTISDKQSDAAPIRDTDGNIVASQQNRPWPLLEHWRMPIPLLRDPDSALADDLSIRMEIDGYLPYADLRGEPSAGGQMINPIARIKIKAAEHAHEDWLAAQNPARSMMELEDGTAVEFRWIGKETKINPAWTRPIKGRHYLEVYVKDKDVRRGYEVMTGQTIRVEGTDYSLKIEELRPSWPLMTKGFQGARTPIALVWVETPERSFQRSVLQRYPQLDQDRDRAGKKILEGGGLVDKNIEISYTDAGSDHFMIVAGENLAATLIHTAPGGERGMKRLEIGEPFTSAGGVELSLEDLIVRPRIETRPVVIPRQNRRSLADVKRQQSLVRVHLQSKDGTWSRRIWVPFSQYGMLHDMNPPTVLHDVPGAGDVRLVYGRMPRRLPTALCLERLKTDYYPGRKQASGWTSYIRYEDPVTGRVKRGKAFLNNTFTLGGWTLFQSGAATDGASWSVLGVGNRRGIVPMLAGCILIALGMIYAFFVKPVLVQRRKRRFAETKRVSREENRHMSSSKSAAAGSSAVKEVVAGILIALATLTASPATAARADETPKDTKSEAVNPAAELAAIQGKIDVKTLGTIAILDRPGWRFTIVDSWARKALRTLHGSTSLYGLDPVVATMELMLNGAAYEDKPIIYVKDKGILHDLTKYPIEVSQAQRKRLYKSRRISHEFLTSGPVMNRLMKLSSNVLKNRAMDRLGNAKYYYENLANLFTIIPNPTGTIEDPWSSPLAVADKSRRPETGLSKQQAAEVLDVFSRFRRAWLDRDLKGINAGIHKLNDILPTLAPAGVYPSLDARKVEMTYRRWDLLWWAWLVYIFAFFVSIFAVSTRYGWVRGAALGLLVLAFAMHGYDLALRWQVLGRVPVANMYEAIVSSTWAGVLLGLLLELFTKKRVYVLSASLLGFFALTLPILLPDKINNDFQTMMPILDDVMLRIHTVLIISSYAVITLAYGVANCYLFVSALRDRTTLAQGVIGAQVGVIGWLVMAKLGAFDDTTAGMVVAAAGAMLAIGALVVVGLFGVFGGGKSRRRGGALQAVAVNAQRSAGHGLNVSDFPVERDVLVEFDRSQLVLLYIAMIALFVGIVLGAVWADYSWGRPWGWDPKEVFALNTWLIYAILIHARFVTKRRALWTSVLSVVGFAAMQFNWWVVNFYIVGLHSYA